MRLYWERDAGLDRATDVRLRATTPEDALAEGRARWDRAACRRPRGYAIFDGDGEVLEYREAAAATG